MQPNSLAMSKIISHYQRDTELLSTPLVCLCVPIQNTLHQKKTSSFRYRQKLYIVYYNVIISLFPRV